MKWSSIVSMLHIDIAVKDPDAFYYWDGDDNGSGESGSCEYIGQGQLSTVVRSSQTTAAKVHKNLYNIYISTNVGIAMYLSCTHVRSAATAGTAFVERCRC